MYSMPKIVKEANWIGSKGLEDDVYLHDDEAPKLWAMPSSDLDKLCFSLTEEALYPFKSYRSQTLEEVARMHPFRIARASSAGYHYVISRKCSDATKSNHE
eukprot:3584513-Amphidinium_carterae.1